MVPELCIWLHYLKNYLQKTTAFYLSWPLQHNLTKEEFSSFFAPPPTHNRFWDNGTFPEKYSISPNLTSDNLR